MKEELWLEFYSFRVDTDDETTTIMEMMARFPYKFFPRFGDIMSEQMYREIINTNAPFPPGQIPPTRDHFCVHSYVVPSTPVVLKKLLSYSLQDEVPRTRDLIASPPSDVGDWGTGDEKWIRVVDYFCSKD